MENLALSHTDLVPLRSRRTNPLELTAPSIQVDVATTKHARICIVREDLLPGGSKQRAATPYVAQKVFAGYEKLVYASPFAGFAQVALAQAARTCGVNLHLFCEIDPNTNRAHEFTELARNFGARVTPFAGLQAAKNAANDFTNQTEKTFQVPLGFDDPIFRSLMRTALTAQWKWLKQSSNLPLRKLWISCGSGTLTKILAQIVGPETTVVAVDVGVLDSDDQRLAEVRSLPNVEYIRLDIPFASRAKSPTPCPSNLHYDAKVWELINENAGMYDVWWNVAR